MTREDVFACRLVHFSSTYTALGVTYTRAGEQISALQILEYDKCSNNNKPIGGGVGGARVNHNTPYIITRRIIL